jgi:hypothetical protein
MPKYILWNPISNKPPKKLFTDFDKALDTARWAAGQSPGEEFIVCRLLEVAAIKDGEDFVSNKPVTQRYLPKSA